MAHPLKMSNRGAGYDVVSTSQERSLDLRTILMGLSYSGNYSGLLIRQTVVQIHSSPPIEVERAVRIRLRVTGRSVKVAHRRLTPKGKRYLLVLQDEIANTCKPYARAGDRRSAILDEVEVCKSLLRLQFQRPRSPTGSRHRP